MANQRMKELRERQAKLIADARAELDTLTEDSTAEERKAAEDRSDKIMEDHDALDSKYQREERLYLAEKAQEDREQDRKDAERNKKKPGAEDRNIDPDDDKDDTPSVDDVFAKSVRFGPSSLSREERAVFNKEIGGANLPPEIRAQSVGTDSQGGYTVPEGFLGEITKTMKDFGPMLDPGVTRVIETGSGNPIPWPTVDDTANSGSLTAENASSSTSGSDVTFGTKQLDAYVYRSGVVLVPTELMMDSFFDFEALLGELLGERLGRSGNTALTVGTGSSQPNGIVTAAGAGVTAAGAAAIAADELLDLEHSVNAAYRRSPRCRFQFADTTLKALRKLKDGQGNYLWQGADLRTGASPSLLGYPYSINDDVPAIATGNKTIVFGDHSRYIVRKVAGFQMIVMRERYAEALQTGFLSWNRIDGELADAAAIKTLQQA